MAVDHIRYDLLVQDALRGVVRTVLEDARKGLPGDHHFYITIDTRAEGVQLSPRMRAQYPEEITIVLQHQFWDLEVTEDRFEVGLAFGGVSERLTVPFTAITGFSDPSVRFGLQFTQIPEGAAEAESAGGKSAAAANAPAEPKTASAVPSIAAAPPGRDPASSAPEDDPHKPSAGGEVVRLDRFRKK